MMMDNYILLLRLQAISLIVLLSDTTVRSYSVSKPSRDPLQIVQSLLENKERRFIKENCGMLCKDCNGIAFLEDDICRCHIKSDYPMQCIHRIEQSAKTLGLRMRVKYPLRRKRCSGGEISEVGFPFDFPTFFGRSAGDQVSSANEQTVGAPNESFSSLTGMLTGPLVEQLRAVFSGDTGTVDSSVPAQIVESIPKAVSSFSSLLDSLNLPVPVSRQNMVGAGRSVDGSDGADVDNDGQVDSQETLRRLQALNRMRAMFIGDSKGNVEDTLPMQLASHLPRALNTAVDLFDSFTVGGARRKDASTVGKSWLKEFDDDDENDKKNENKLPEKKLIVSPFKSNSQVNMEAGNIIDTKSSDNIVDNVGALLGSGEPQILQPQEAVIIISPIGLSQSSSGVTM